MPWFTAQARDDNPRHAHVVIDKPIGSDWAPDWISDFTGQQPAREFIAAVDALGELDEITVEINSPGGDVASGVRIFHYLRDHQATIHTRVTGMAASIATIIMMAGKTRSMAIGSNLMTHRASALLFGAFNVSEMQDLAQNLGRVDASLIDIYAAATGKGKEKIAGLLDQGDTYLTAEEALEWGFATQADEELRAVACADPKTFMRELEQHAEITRLRSEAAQHIAVAEQLRAVAQQGEGQVGGKAAMTCADVMALYFDVTPEQAEAQAADLGDQLLASKGAAGEGGKASAKAVAEPFAKVLGMEVDAVISDPKAAADQIGAKVDEAGELAISQDRARISAIIKACQTTGQTQLLEKLVENGMAEAQASEYIYDVAAASGNRHSIHNSHSPEGGHRVGIDYQKIYDRQNRKATA